MSDPLKGAFLASICAFCLLMVGLPAALYSESDSNISGQSFSIQVGLASPHAELQFDPFGTGYTVRDFKIKSETSWQVRAEFGQALGDATVFLFGLGLARDKLFIEEQGWYSDTNGGPDPSFDNRSTTYNVLWLEVPLKVRFDFPAPSDREAVFFSMGPKISINLFDDDMLSPNRSGVRRSRNPIAFEFGGGVRLQTIADKRAMIIVTYSVDLTDRIQSDTLSQSSENAPYGTWSEFKIQTLVFSVGLEF